MIWAGIVVITFVFVGAANSPWGNSIIFQGKRAPVWQAAVSF